MTWAVRSCWPGARKKFSLGAVIFVGQQGAAHVAIVVEFLCFVAVVNRERKTAAQARAHFRDPGAGFQVYFRELSFEEGDSLLGEIVG